MVKLRPFRDYDEKDVINLFALETSGLETPITSWDTRVTAGTLVKLSDAGWHANDELQMLEAAGTLDPQNVTSQRYGVLAKVEVAATNQDVVFGMLLNHVAIHDENGEQLKFNPRKASELEACIPGQAVPIVRRGVFLVDSPGLTSETFTAGTKLTNSSTAAYNDGDFTTAGASAGDTIVGYTMGNNTAGANAHNHHLIMLDIGGVMA